MDDERFPKVVARHDGLSVSTDIDRYDMFDFTRSTQKPP